MNCWICLVFLSAGFLTAARGEFRLYLVDGNSELEAPAVYSLGHVAAGDAAQARFRLRNTATAPALLSYLEVRGTGFSPKNPLALPMTVDPTEPVDFTVTFSAPDTGMYSAALVSEGTSVILTATVDAAPPLPLPKIAVDLPRALSGQQGSVMVNFDEPAARAGTGSLVLDFKSNVAGAADAAIAFSSGTRTLAFSFDRGDRQGKFGGQPAALFQTGTTTGALTLIAQTGSVSDQATITIGKALVGFTDAQGTRSTGSIEIRLTGFDNTRTAGALTFTFFGASGSAIPPGTIRVDATQAFQQLYQGSDAGGTFLLRAVFPVSGDPSRIAAFEASITNSEGAVLAGHTKF